MQLLDLFAGLLWLSSVIFLLFVLDVGDAANLLI